MMRIAIFASGSGSNAERIIEHFASSDLGRVVLLLSDNPNARALQRASDRGVPAHFFSDWAEAMGLLQEYNIDYIVLAGFLRLVPSAVLDKFKEKIVNIHPALLPAYGGKGMYGDRVHRAVIAAGEKQSGITIHRVNARYDEGDILAQFTCPVLPDDTVETLAERIHALEHTHFSEIIEKDIKL